MDAAQEAGEGTTIPKYRSTLPLGKGLQCPKKYLVDSARCRILTEVGLRGHAFRTFGSRIIQCPTVPALRRLCTMTQEGRAGRLPLNQYEEEMARTLGGDELPVIRGVQDKPSSANW